MSTRVTLRDRDGDRVVVDTWTECLDRGDLFQVVVAELWGRRN